MKTKVNLSQTVKVRLTDYGIRVLKMQDEIINNSTFDFFKQRLLATGKPMPNIEEKVTPLVVDKDGYTAFELKDLMERFATHLDYKNPPYELDILIEDAEESKANVIPKFVAECIEFCNKLMPLHETLNSIYTHEYGDVDGSGAVAVWLDNDDNMELFVNAWNNGYVIE